MQTPKRKPGKYQQMPQDHTMTQQKYDQIEADLERMYARRPKMAAEVSRLAENGDFSENAEYQLAKGKLRGLNNRILILENQLRQAKVIQTPTNIDQVQLGSTVTVEMDGKEKAYTVLGASEADPSMGIISHESPLGSALMGASVGDEVVLETTGKTLIVLKIA